MKLIKEIKSKKGVLHFRRWRILSTPIFSIYIHGIYHHDEDEHLHNHPWKIWTMVLWGGYYEKLLNETGNMTRVKLRRPFNMGYRARNRFHKIESMYKSPTYTLAIVGKRTEFWGYMVNGRFVGHNAYRKNKRGK